jgi:hypothetical protein
MESLSINPTSLTKSQLRSLLSANGAPVPPLNVKKDVLISLFSEHVFLKKPKKVVPSSKGIIFIDSHVV